MMQTNPEAAEVASSLLGGAFSFVTGGLSMALGWMLTVAVVMLPVAIALVALHLSENRKRRRLGLPLKRWR